MSVAEKMTAIADAIRAKTGSGDGLTLDGMAQAIPAVFAAGEAESHARCVAKHFVGSFVGDGSRVATVAIPFKPDIIAVSNFSTEIMNTQYAITSLHYNAVKAGTLHAYVGITDSNSGGYYFALMTASSVANRIVYENGVLTLQNFGGSSRPAFFMEGQEYAVVAAKLTDAAPVQEKMMMTYSLRRPTEDAEGEGGWEVSE